MNTAPHRWMLPIAILFSALIAVNASAAQFRKRELFQIPFGKERAALGATIADSQFLIPRQFTVDGLGRFYINDSQKHRIARYSPVGTYEMGVQYPATATQVFAHPDARNNLWLMLADPQRGFYYGVYDPQGRRLREGVFAKFSRFRLHVGDDHRLLVILSSDRDARSAQSYFLDPESYLMKKQALPLPPEGHHHIRRQERSYYVHPIPGAASRNAEPLMQITDESRQAVAQIKGHVIYVTDEGDIYTRVQDCRLNIYDVKGTLRGTLDLDAHPASCTALRFDQQGHIFLLDGIPDARGSYTAEMPGMRMLLWERR